MKKTQAFIVMGFIITTTLAIGLFMQKEEEKNIRIKVENMLTSIINEKNSMEIALNRSINEKEKTISFLLAELDKERVIRTKLTENLSRANKRFGTALAQAKNPVELEKIIVSSLLEAEGKVLAVDRINDLIVINLGASNNLKNGDRLSVYRGDDFIANAELIKVQDRLSAAMILPGQNDIDVQVNDWVK